MAACDATPLSSPLFSLGTTPSPPPSLVFPEPQDANDDLGDIGPGSASNTRTDVLAHNGAVTSDFKVRICGSGIYIAADNAPCSTDFNEDGWVNVK